MNTLEKIILEVIQYTELDCSSWDQSVQEELTSQIAEHIRRHRRRLVFTPGRPGRPISGDHVQPQLPRHGKHTPRDI